MISSSAERNDNQSGPRFLDSSDPLLKRHIASCEAAGRGREPLPAGKDEKGLPVGAQLMARPFEEAEMLAMAHKLETLF